MAARMQTRRRRGAAAREALVSERGYWLGAEATALGMHDFDEKLSAGLVSFFAREAAARVADLGCGAGHYVAALNAAHILADGFDGNPATVEMTGGAASRCSVLDLSVPQRLSQRYDWVLSLEVGEHLPRAYEAVFLGNLHANNTRGIVLSWAIVGQGGDGHVNERDNDYVREQIHALGYITDHAAEARLRSSVRLDYFANTVMVFRRRVG